MKKMSTSSKMCKVRVQLVGVLRGLAGKNEISIKSKTPVKIKQLIQDLSDSLGFAFKQAVIDPELNDPRPNTLILVNDVEISALQGLETKVGEDDTIVVIPVSHGG